MKPDGTIIDYIVLEHKETPGLGTKMDDWFKSDRGNRSIIGKNPGKNKLIVNKDGGEVDAITAATVTSRAFLHAVEVAYNTYTKKADATSSATKQQEIKTEAPKTDVVDSESAATKQTTETIKQEKNESTD